LYFSLILELLELSSVVLTLVNGLGDSDLVGRMDFQISEVCSKFISLERAENLYIDGIHLPVLCYQAVSGGARFVAH
jgi:hypothetical protein